MGSSKKFSWLSLEDLDNDLCEFSEIAVSQDDVSEPPLATIVQYRAQMSANHNSSVFDTDMMPHDNVTYVSSGRGRGGLSTFYRPGMPANFNSDQEVYRKIREVSGIGYSNEVIEKSVRAKRQQLAADLEFSDAPSTSGRPTASSSNTRSSTPSYPMPFASGSSSSAAKPREPENKEAPLPLSVMLKRAKETAKETVKNQSSIDEVQAVTDSYAKMVMEPPKAGAQPKIEKRSEPPNVEKRRESPNMEAGSSSESSHCSQYSWRNCSSTSTTETSYNTAGSSIENPWYNRPSQLIDSSSSSSNADDQLSWRKTALRTARRKVPFSPRPVQLERMNTSNDDDGTLLWRKRTVDDMIFTEKKGQEFFDRHFRNKRDHYNKKHDSNKKEDSNEKDDFSFNFNSKRDFPGLR